MNRHSIQIMASAAVFAMAVWQASAGDDLIENGGFEQPGGGSQFNLDGSSAIPGWNITQGNVDIVGTDYKVGGVSWNSPEGSQSLDLNGSMPGRITQTFDGLTAGTYRLSFFYSGNFEIGTDPDNRDFTISLGETTMGFSALQSGGTVLPLTWVKVSQDVRLSGPTELAFASLVGTVSGDPRNPYCGPVIDGVSLTLVPEPYQYGLASVLGLLGLVTVDRIRQRKLRFL